MSGAYTLRRWWMLLGQAALVIVAIAWTASRGSAPWIFWIAALFGMASL